MLLEGKRLLITGVLTPGSIAFAAAKVAQEQGAEIVLTGFGKGMGLTEKSSHRLPDPPDVLEMDVNNQDHIEAVAAELKSRWGNLDGFLHAIAFAPQDALGGNFMNTPWESVATAVQTSAYSLKALAGGLQGLMEEDGGSIVGLDFDAQVAWPIYDWMGPAKAALESTMRYLARYLGDVGIRVNCVSSGPLKTIAAKGIPGFDEIASAWEKQAPLGWDVHDADPVGRAIAFLLSDWSDGITGEIIHVDGGFHAMGTRIRGYRGDPAGDSGPDS